MAIPDYLVIGHITKDLVPGGFTVGGTVTYAAVTARNLGQRAAIVTSAEAELVLPPVFEGIQVVRVPAQATTTFHNIYTNGTRQQVISALADPIGPDVIPPEYRQAPLIHLAPLVREIDESLVHHFPGSRVVATPQGWFRSWDDAGYVSLGEWPGAERLLPYLTVLVLSDEDVRGDPLFIEGRLSFYSWEKNGQRRSKLSVVAERVQLMPRGNGQPRDDEQRAESFSAGLQGNPAVRSQWGC